MRMAVQQDIPLHEEIALSVQCSEIRFGKSPVLVPWRSSKKFGDLPGTSRGRCRSRIELRQLIASLRPDQLRLVIRCL